MKKILVVTESKTIWGAERSLLQLAEFAHSNGVELEFLISESSPLAGELETRGFLYKFHEFATHPALNSKGSLSGASLSTLGREAMSVLRGAARLRRAIRGYDSVLVFSIWQAPETMIASWLAGRAVDIDLHETFSNRRAMTLVGLISRGSRKVFVPSQVLALRSGLALSTKVSVIPRPVSYEIEELTGRDNHSSAPMTVGVFGQIQPHKNVLGVVQAVSTLKGSVRLLVVGGQPEVSLRTPYELEVRRAVSALGSDSSVVDMVDDVTGLMRACDVVVNASDHEAFGRTIIEAVAAGSFPVSVGDWGPKETIDRLGVGISVEDTTQLSGVFADLLAKRKGGPLLPCVPETLSDYAAQSVAQKYFSQLTSPPKRTWSRVHDALFKSS